MFGYGGYLTKISREQNHTARPATQTKYRSLLNLKLSDPSTVKTVMIESQRLTSDCGQQFVTITADQQIYKVIVDNKIYGLPQMYSIIYIHA